MFLAENSISLIIASLLYVFNIEKATDADGMALKPEVDYDGFIWYVLSDLSMVSTFQLDSSHLKPSEAFQVSNIP